MVALRTRLRSHLAIPLHRSAYALMLSVIGSSALGLLFWVIASRQYSAEAVGVSSAAVAALMFLTGVGGLYLDAVLYRFLPRSGDRTGQLLSWASLLTVVSGVAAAGIFILGIDIWAPALSFARSSPWAVIACVAGVVGSCLMLLQDGAFIGLRRAGWVPVKNTIYGVAKIVVLVVVASIWPTYGILAAWVLPGVIILIPYSFILVGWLVPRHLATSDSRQESMSQRQVVGYAAGNYIGYLFTLAYRYLPPLLVIHEAGPVAAAYFYPPWLIATSLMLLTSNVSVSLVVEGAFDRAALALHTRRALLQVARLLLPSAALLFLAAPYVLMPFGHDYSDEGATLLRLMALSLIPSSICILSFGVARIQDRVGAIIVNQVALAVLVLGLSMVLLPPLGIEGVGVAWLISQFCIALILFYTQLRPALSGRSLTPDATAQRPGEGLDVPRGAA